MTLPTPRTSWIVSLALIAVAIVATAVVYAGLPSRIPTHWNLQGEVDGHGPAAMVFIIPGMMLIVAALFAVLPKVLPRGAGLQDFWPLALVILALTMAFMLYLNGVILWATLRPRMPIAAWLFGGVFGFLAVMAPLMTRVPRNPLIGIRTPWTLASDRVWNDTHWLASRTIALGSMVGLVCVARGAFLLAIAALAFGLLVPVFYSFLHARTLRRESADFHHKGTKGTKGR